MGFDNIGVVTFGWRLWKMSTPRMFKKNNFKNMCQPIFLTPLQKKMLPKNSTVHN